MVDFWHKWKMENQWRTFLLSFAQLNRLEPYTDAIELLHCLSRKNWENKENGKLIHLNPMVMVTWHWCKTLYCIVSSVSAGKFHDDATSCLALRLFYFRNPFGMRLCVNHVVHIWMHINNSIRLTLICSLTAWYKPHYLLKWFPIALTGRARDRFVSSSLMQWEIE